MSSPPPWWSTSWRTTSGARGRLGVECCCSGLLQPPGGFCPLLLPFGPQIWGVSSPHCLPCATLTTKLLTCFYHPTRQERAVHRLPQPERGVAGDGLQGAQARLRHGPAAEGCAGGEFGGGEGLGGCHMCRRRCAAAHCRHGLAAPLQACCCAAWRPPPTRPPSSGPTTSCSASTAGRWVELWGPVGG